MPHRRLQAACAEPKPLVGPVSRTTTESSQRMQPLVDQDQAEPRANRAINNQGCRHALSVKRRASLGRATPSAASCHGHLPGILQSLFCLARRRCSPGRDSTPNGLVRREALVRETRRRMGAKATRWLADPCGPGDQETSIVLPYLHVGGAPINEFASRRVRPTWYLFQRTRAGQSSSAIGLSEINFRADDSGYSPWRPEWSNLEGE